MEENENVEVKKEKKEKKVRLGKRVRSFKKGLILGLIAGIVLTSFVFISFREKVFDKIDAVKENFDYFIDNRRTGYTAVDFGEVIMKASVEKQELIVMEQNVEITTNITKSGLGSLAIFSKSKDITYAGTGVYTVDLSGINIDSVTVDNDNRIVTLSVPHSALKYVNIDYDNCKFEDTEKGFLAFGDLSFTVEQQTELEKTVQAEMRKNLESESLLSKADEYAVSALREIFAPYIYSINSTYELEIAFI